MTHLIPLRVGYWTVTALAASVFGSLLCTTLLLEPMRHDSVPAPPVERTGPWLEVNVTRAEAPPPPPASAFTAHPDEVASHLPLSLLATLETDNPRESSATIFDRSSGEVRIYGVGQRIEGDALIVGIERGRVHLVHAGKPEHLEVDLRLDGAPRKPYKHAGPMVQPHEVRCSDNACTVSRGFIEHLLQNPSLLAMQARIVPALQDGEPTGFKLYGVRRDSLPRLMGFKNGDLITAINGEPLGGMDHAMAAYTRLRAASRLEIDVVRRGEPLQLVLNIE